MTPYLLIQNQNIVPGTRWIVRQDERERPDPFYTAQIREFDTEIQARTFSLAKDGVLVPGKNWVLVFSGVADSTLFPVSINALEEIPEVLKGMADWLSAH